MFRVEAHVPLTNNEGKIHSQDSLRDLELLILGYSSGFMKSLNEAVWYSADGGLFQDQVMSYTVNMCNGILADQLKKDLANYIMETFQQDEAHILIYKLEPMMLQQVYQSVDFNEDLSIPLGVASWTQD